jgi:predicted HicB family RNase H-like nuclease
MKPKYITEKRRSPERRALVSVRMSNEERAALSETADARGCSVNDLAREALSQYWNTEGS